MSADIVTGEIEIRVLGRAHDDARAQHDAETAEAKGRLHALGAVTYLLYFTYLLTYILTYKGRLHALGAVQRRRGRRLLREAEAAAAAAGEAAASKAVSEASAAEELGAEQVLLVAHDELMARDEELGAELVLLMAHDEELNEKLAVLKTARGVESDTREGVADCEGEEAEGR